MKTDKDTKNIILAVESSTLSGGVAVAADGIIIGCIRFNSKKTYSRRLMSGVDFILKELDLRLEDLNALAISLGPGSFTGIRIGLSAVKGLAYTCRIPLIGVSALESLALRMAEPNAVIIPMLDAYKGEVFAQTFTINPDSGQPVPYQNSKPFIGFVNEYLENAPAGAIIGGNAIKRFPNEIKSYTEKRFRIAPDLRSSNSPEEIAVIAHSRFINNQFDDGSLLEPVYLRNATHVAPTVR